MPKGINMNNFLEKPDFSVDILRIALLFSSIDLWLNKLMS
jgi:hypothetical protein